MTSLAATYYIDMPPSNFVMTLSVILCNIGASCLLRHPKDHRVTIRRTIQVCARVSSVGCQRDATHICCWTPAPAARRPQLSIDIFCPQSAQQQTRWPPLLLSIGLTGLCSRSPVFDWTVRFFGARSGWPFHSKTGHGQVKIRYFIRYSF